MDANKARMRNANTREYGSTARKEAHVDNKPITAHAVF